MDLKVSKVVVDVGEILVIELPSEKTKSVAVCPTCSGEMKAERIPRTEQYDEDGLKSMLFYAYHCHGCNGPYWNINGKELRYDDCGLNVKKKEVINEGDIGKKD